MSITVYGASDDCIEVEGDITEEFNALIDRHLSGGHLLAFSDGTILRITYTKTGVWRITLVASGTATLSIQQAPEDDDSNYTDRAVLDGNIGWVVHGIAHALKQ